MKLAILKLKTSLSAVLKVLAIPAYGLLAALIAALVMWLLLWIFNLHLLWVVFSSQVLTLLDKIGFLLAGFESIFTNFEAPQALTLLAFSLLSGINLAALVFVLRHGRLTAAAGSSNFFAATAALIGSGCAVCGGSLLGPLAAIGGATLSAGAAARIGTAANVAGISLLLFSIYGIGKACAHIQARNQL